MAKYVLLSFADDDAAAGFVGQLDENGSATLFAASEKDDGGCEVVAEFKKPTLFCECTKEQRRGKGLKHGQKYGWLVCGNCNRPTKGGGQVIYNLLEANQPPWRKQLHLQVRCEYSGWLEPNWTPPQQVRKDRS